MWIREIDNDGDDAGNRANIEDALQSFGEGSLLCDFFSVLHALRSAKDGCAIGVDKEVEEDVVDRHIDEGLRAENRTADGKTDKTGVPVDYQHLIREFLIPRDFENKRENIAHPDENGIKDRAPEERSSEPVRGSFPS